MGLFHLTNDGECSWFEFARGAFDLGGVEAKMEPIDSGQLGQRARRPPYSALPTTRLEAVGLKPLRPWKEALNDYLQTKGVI